MKPDPLITYRRKPARLNVSQLETFAETLRARVARGREFHCRITNDEELASLNARFRKKKYPTDVLSFPAAGNGVDGLGDIAISLDRARAQAKEWHHSLEEELCILLLHGVLHLTGLDHETDSGQMRRSELRWRRKLGLTTGLIERASSERTRA
jgi:probable rRNA maturation factor